MDFAGHGQILGHMEKGDFREKMLEAIDRTGISIAELSRRSGVTYDAINKLKRGSSQSTSSENTARLADVLGIQLTEQTFPSRVENGDNPPDGSGMVPVYDVYASAGFGSLVGYEEQTHGLAFPPAYLRKLTNSSTRDLVIISVKGDSMEPTLLDDDVVLVDKSKTHMGYEGMFVLRHNDTLLVKRAGMAAKPGRVTLISDNKTYPPVDAALVDLHVVGKVLWYGRKV